MLRTNCRLAFATRAKEVHHLKNSRDFLNLWFLHLSGCSKICDKCGAPVHNHFQLEYTDLVIPYCIEDAFTFMCFNFSSQQQKGRKECSCCIIGSRFPKSRSQFCQSMKKYRLGQYFKNFLQNKCTSRNLKDYVWYKRPWKTSSFLILCKG